MAARKKRDKRTSGTVQHVTNAYGFIELHNKDLPISTVFFDRRSSSDIYEGMKLSEAFPKGCNVTFTFVPTDGEHKVKHKAINMVKQGPGKQRSHDSGANAHQQTNKPRGGEHYLRKYLSDNGATHMNILVQKLSMRTDNCPKFLRSMSVEELIDFTNEHSDLFEIRHDYLCLREMESSITEKLTSNLADYPQCAFNIVRRLFPAKQQPGIYLYGCGKWMEGIRDFVARNPETFIIMSDRIYEKEEFYEDGPQRSNFQKELRAVKYYSEFVLAKGWLPVNSLSGHFNQANAEIKTVVSPKSDEFLEFLERHAFFFVLNGPLVSCPPHRLAVIDRVWLKKGHRSRQRKGSKQKQQADNLLDCQRFSKAFSGLVCDPLPVKKPMPCSDESDAFTAQYSFQASIHALPRLREPRSPGKGKAQKIYATPEARAFREIVGGDIAQAIEKEVTHAGGDSLNDVVLVRFNVGKKPVVKIYVNDASTNIPMKQLKEVDVEDLQKMVRSKTVIKTGVPLHYGIKGTLHSIRTIEQAGKISGLTLLCQLHEDSDGLGIDIAHRKRLTAILSDPASRPLKFVYNYMRTRSKEVAVANDVLVLDVDGQLSGCDGQPHASLGNVTRIACSSSSELPDRIKDAIQHMHEYAVVVGVDTPDVLRAIQKMCAKGIEVIAEVPADLKGEVETIFSS